MDQGRSHGAGLKSPGFVIVKVAKYALPASLFYSTIIHGKGCRCITTIRTLFASYSGDLFYHMSVLIKQRTGSSHYFYFSLGIFPLVPNSSAPFDLIKCPS